MKAMKLALIAAILLAAAPSSSFADQKACEDCINKVRAQLAECLKTKDQVTCNKENQQAAQACANGACKK